MINPQSLATPSNSVVVFAISNDAHDERPVERLAAIVLGAGVEEVAGPESIARRAPPLARHTSRV